MEEQKNTNTWFERNIVKIATTIGLLTIILLLVGYRDYLNFSFKIEPSLISTFGDFLSGFLGAAFGMITIYLVYQTFKSQKEELRLSRNLIQRQNFENTFFSLLSSLNQIRNSLVVENKLENKKTHEFYKEEFRGIVFFENQKGNLHKENFFDGYDYIKNGFSSEQITEQLKQFLTQDSMFTKKYMHNVDYDTLDSNQIKRIKLLATYYFFYKRYTEFLDHYFQSVELIIKYINSSIIDTQDSTPIKEFYTDILQSQLSSPELFHIYHYCLLSEDYRQTVLTTNILSRLYQGDLISEDVHKSYYYNTIMLAETPLVLK